MSEDRFLQQLDEAIKRLANRPYSEILEGLKQRGIVNEKGEVIVRMPIGPGPNGKKKRKRKKADDAAAAE
jgi:hypothetical protein